MKRLLKTLAGLPFKHLPPGLLTIVLSFYTAAATAESGNYRIEVLIFNHIDSGALPKEFDEIRSFSGSPELGETLEREAPVQIEVMSDIMQDTWRRLRLSSGFRPLLFGSWEQTRIDFHPPVRLHDDELIAKQLHFPHDVVFVDLRETNLFDDYMSSYYRLDGTVQLRRSRFLHLDLDIEYRQNLLPRPDILQGSESNELPIPRVMETQPPKDDISNNTSADTYTGDLTDLLDPSPGPALLFNLKQSRQIRTNQMQYFDSPFLGVLVRVTATTGI